MNFAHDWRVVLRHAWSIRSPLFCGLNSDQESALCFAAVLTRASEIQAGDRAA